MEICELSICKIEEKIDIKDFPSTSLAIFFIGLVREKFLVFSFEEIPFTSVCWQFFALSSQTKYIALNKAYKPLLNVKPGVIFVN